MMVWLLHPAAAATASTIFGMANHLPWVVANNYNCVLPLVAITTGILVVVFVMSRKKHLINLPPGSYGWPILGETLEFLGEGTPGRFVETRMDKYKSGVFKTRLMGDPVAVLCGTAGNKMLFCNENKLVQVWWPASTRRLLGRCLSTTVGDEAKQARKLLSSFVAPDALMRYIHTLHLHTRNHILTHWQGKEEVAVFPTVKDYTFRLACRLFLSLEDSSHITKLADLFKVFLKGVISIPLNIPGTRFARAIRAAESVRKELLLIVKDRKVALERQKASPSQDLLSHLLVSPDENGKFMSETEIVNNILLLLFAGHDTSSVAITLLIKKLAELPQVYNKILREQQEIASTKGEEELLKWEDIQKMKYSWSVMCEVFRLQPPVMGAFREAMVSLNFDGYIIPKGWKLYWNTTSTHRDPSLFPESENFDPSRFEGAGPPPFSYVPFGGGARMCLGKEYARVEILVFLYNVINKFRWNLQFPDEKIIYDPMPTPVHGLPVRLLPHNHLSCQ